MGLIAMMSTGGAELLNRTCFNCPTLGDLHKYATYQAMLKHKGTSLIIWRTATAICVRRIPHWSLRAKSRVNNSPTRPGPREPGTRNSARPTVWDPKLRLIRRGEMAMAKISKPQNANPGQISTSKCQTRKNQMSLGSARRALPRPGSPYQIMR
jgi:hypothetical protein